MSTDRILKELFNIETPLGPISSNEFYSPEHKEIFHAYFDTHNFSYQQIKRRPTMIVGRKGAGKTDALISQAIDKGLNQGTSSVITYFSDNDSANTLTLVIQQIVHAILETYPGPMVESVAEFWDGLFWISIFAKIVQENKSDSSSEIKVLSKYMKQYHIDDNVAKDPRRVMFRSIKVLREAYQKENFKNFGIGFFNALPDISLGGINLDDAIYAATNWLIRNEFEAYILFDSVECIDLIEATNHLAISAMLKSIGGFSKPGSPVKIRCCIPSESYFHLTDISSNTIKDFRSVMVLQWTPDELLRITAKRYLKFIQLWYPREYDKIVDRFDTTSRSGAIEFWESMLPDIVRNARNGKAERTLTYILRHTQLLPRHIIFILNAIIRRAISGSTGKGLPRIAAEDVVEEIKNSEIEIVKQILDSYTQMWPQANKVLEALVPEIKSNIIKYKELQILFNRSPSKGLMKGQGFHSTVRMLSELGAVGRLIRTTDRFHTGVFEYSEPNRLIFTPDDVLCFHPVFSSYYRAIPPEVSPKNFRPVYPYGVAPGSADRRVDRSILFHNFN